MRLRRGHHMRDIAKLFMVRCVKPSHLRLLDSPAHSALDRLSVVAESDPCSRQNWSDGSAVGCLVMLGDTLCYSCPRTQRRSGRSLVWSHRYWSASRVRGSAKR